MKNMRKGFTLVEVLIVVWFGVKFVKSPHYNLIKE